MMTGASARGLGAQTGSFLSIVALASLAMGAASLGACIEVSRAGAPDADGAGGGSDIVVADSVVTDAGDGPGDVVAVDDAPWSDDVDPGPDVDAGAAVDARGDASVDAVDTVDTAPPVDAGPPDVMEDPLADVVPDVLPDVGPDVLPDVGPDVLEEDTDCEPPDCGDRVCGAVESACGDVISCGICGETEACTNDGQCVCLPQCADKECGDDGCGGDCGPCMPGLGCVDSVCICVSSCEGKSCGDDGCGGSCGACGLDLTCVAGVCVCETDCGDKECGDDGCGGLCGVCGDGKACEAGQCIVSWVCGDGECEADEQETCPADCFDCTCEGVECGPDACGNSCGGCLATQSCKQGECVGIGSNCQDEPTCSCVAAACFPDDAVIAPGLVCALPGAGECLTIMVNAYAELGECGNACDTHIPGLEQMCKAAKCEELIQQYDPELCEQCDGDNNDCGQPGCSGNTFCTSGGCEVGQYEGEWSVGSFGDPNGVDFFVNSWLIHLVDGAQDGPFDVAVEFLEPGAFFDFGVLEGTIEDNSLIATSGESDAGLGTVSLDVDFYWIGDPHTLPDGFEGWASQIWPGGLFPPVQWQIQGWRP